MARAKRTDRTEARRRYRAEQAVLLGEDDDATEADETEGAATTARQRAAKPGATSRQERPGIMAAFRGAVRPLDWREDLRSLPVLARHWSLFVPVLLSVVSTVLFVAATASITDAKNPPSDMFTTVAIVLYQFFVIPPPVAGAFLAGLGAPKASWLLGAIVGVVAAIGNAVIVLSTFGRLTYQQPELVILQGFVFAPFGAALFASMAAWYRRFLNLANPNRGQKPVKPARGRGNMPTNSRAPASRRP